MEWLLRRVGLLAVMLFAVQVAVLGAAQMTYHDIFAPYTALMPGQSIDGLKEYPCQFRATMVKDLEFFALGYCQFTPEYGTFSEVALNVKDRIITRITFFDIQPGVLRLGELILHWGKPRFVQFPMPNIQIGELDWDNQMSASFLPDADSAQAGYSLSISTLSIGLGKHGLPFSL